MANVIVVFGFLLGCVLIWITVRERQYRMREDEFANRSSAWLAHEQELLGHIAKLRRELMQEYKAHENMAQQITELHAWREQVLRHQTQQDTPTN